MPRSVEDFFDARAVSFDSIYAGESRICRWFNRIFRKAIYERYGIAIGESGNVTGKSVLDIGCGSGRYMIEYARRGAARVVGVEISAKMLELARSLAIQEGVRGQYDFIHGDFMDVSFDSKFDIVLAMGVFDYLQEPVEFLARMARLCRGILIASFPGWSMPRGPIRWLRYRLRGQPIFFYSKEDVRDLARAAGIEKFSLVYIPYSGGGHVLLGRTPKEPCPD